MKLSHFRWSKKRRLAAELLAAGFTNAETAQRVGVSERTIYRWKCYPDFLTEVDHLTLNTHLAQKAERLRLAYRIIADKAKQASRKDLLDWLEYLRQELEGTKHELDIGSALASIVERLAGTSDPSDQDAS